MAVQVNNLQGKVEVPPGTEVLLCALAHAALVRTGQDEVEIGITLADNSYLQELNREYRGIDAPTDVLSFAMHEMMAGEPVHARVGPDLLGDVVISMERALIQADELGHSLQRELAYLSVHGLLHLLGYGHDQPEQEDLMRSITEEILLGQGLK